MPLASRRPDDSELVLPYHREMVARLSGDDVLDLLSDQLYWICELGSHVCAESADKLHPPYTWTVRQVFEHCADAERVFGYRILRAAAGDSTDLSTWNENEYADSRFGLGTMTNLISELGALRQSNLLMLQRIVPKAWDHKVTVDSEPISVRAMAWVTAAHLAHHFEIIETRCDITVQRTMSM